MHRKIKAPVVGCSLEGRVQVLVIDDKTRQVIRQYPVQKNLILNNGMDMMATTLMVSCFTNCVAGTGTTPTRDGSGLTTAAQASTTVTLVGGAFTFTNTGTDAGKMIKFDSGEEARIVTVTDATHAEVANSATVVASTFAVYRTNQNALAVESKRTSTYLTGSANCGTVWTGNVAAHKRTYDFSVESGSVTYAEIGFSNTASVGSNLFSRILLGSTVPLVAGQALRVVYTLSITWTPSTPQAVAVSPITGWAGATGVQQIQIRVTQEIATDGTTAANSGASSGCLEPSNTVAGFTPGACLCSDSTAHNTFGTAGPARTSIASTTTITLSAYTALNFYREKSVTFAVGVGNASNIRAIVLSESGSALGSAQSLVYIIDSNQTKDNLHTLTITWRITWSRTLA